MSKQQTNIRKTNINFDYSKLRDQRDPKDNRKTNKTYEPQSQSQSQSQYQSQLSQSKTQIPNNKAKSKSSSCEKVITCLHKIPNPTVDKHCTFTLTVLNCSQIFNAGSLTITEIVLAGNEKVPPVGSFSTPSALADLLGDSWTYVSLLNTNLYVHEESVLNCSNPDSHITFSNGITIQLTMVCDKSICTNCEDFNKNVEVLVQKNSDIYWVDSSCLYPTGLTGPVGPTGPATLEEIVEKLLEIDTDLANCKYNGVYDPSCIGFLDTIIGTYSIATALNDATNIVSGPIQFANNIQYQIALAQLNITIADNVISISSSPSPIDRLLYFNNLGQIIASFELFAVACCPTGVSGETEILTKISETGLGWVPAECLLKCTINLEEEVNKLDQCHEYTTTIEFNTVLPFLNNNSNLYDLPWIINQLILLGEDVTADYAGTFNNFKELGDILAANGWKNIEPDSDPISSIYLKTIFSDNPPANPYSIIRISTNSIVPAPQVFFCYHLPITTTPIDNENLQLIYKTNNGLMLCGVEKIFDAIEDCAEITYDCTTFIQVECLIAAINVATAPWKINSLVVSGYEQTIFPTLFTTSQQLAALLINMGWTQDCHDANLYSLTIKSISAENMANIGKSSIVIHGNNGLNKLIKLKVQCQFSQNTENCYLVDKANTNMYLTRDLDGNICWSVPPCTSSSNPCCASNCHSSSNCHPTGCTGFTGCTGCSNDLVLNIPTCDVEPLYTLTLTLNKTVIDCIKKTFCSYGAGPLGPYWIYSYKLKDETLDILEKVIIQPFSLKTLVQALIDLGWQSDIPLIDITDDSTVEMTFINSPIFITTININLVNNTGETLPYNYEIPVDGVNNINCPGLSSDAQVLIKNGSTGCGLCFVSIDCIIPIVPKPVDVIEELCKIEACPDPIIKNCVIIDQCNINKLTEIYGPLSILEITQYKLVSEPNVYEINPHKIIGANITLDDLKDALVDLGWIVEATTPSSYQLTLEGSLDISYIVINVAGANPNVAPYPYMLGVNCTKTVTCESLDHDNSVLIRKPDCTLCWMDMTCLINQNPIDVVSSVSECDSPGVSIRPAGPNVWLSIGPNTTGGGFLSATTPDGTIAGGDCRGQHAVDWQIDRSASDQVASGTNSFIGSGVSNLAAGHASAVVGGTNNRALGALCFIGGGNNNISGGSGTGSFVGAGNTNKAIGLNSAVVVGTLNIASGERSFIGGGFHNTASGQDSVVVGGADNRATNNQTFIGGGVHNTASGVQSTVVAGSYNQATNNQTFIGGGAHNTASGEQSTIAGGSYNQAIGNRSFIGGGLNNTAIGNQSSVVTGYKNKVSGQGSFIGAGYSNAASGQDSVVVGGSYNSANNNGQIFIGGGLRNTASGLQCVIVGGGYNRAIGQRSFIGAGANNTASNFNSAVVAGTINIAQGSNNFIGGGFNNITNGQDSVAVGGAVNRSTNDQTFIGGGVHNTASGEQSAIAGGSYNVASDNRAFIGGGYSNAASGQDSVVVGGSYNSANNNGQIFIGGGLRNTASGLQCVIVGGGYNRAIGQRSFIGAGANNTASNFNSAVVAGSNNTAQGTNSFIGGGFNNTASGQDSVAVGGAVNRSTNNQTFIGGGVHNTASGEQSAIAGGSYNVASNNRAFIGAGYSNAVSGQDSVVVGGSYNSANNNGQIFIGGGMRNTASGLQCVIVGGGYNRAIGQRSFIGAGANNTASNFNSAVVAGTINIAQGSNNFIGGGFNNITNGQDSVAVGGAVNRSTNDQTFIGGGVHNTASGSQSSVVGGGYNKAYSAYSFIGGGNYNLIESDALQSIIVGGRSNTIEPGASHSTIIGGRSNTIQSLNFPSLDTSYSTIVGGQSNTIGLGSGWNVISGGRSNTVEASAYYNVLAGGKSNTIQSLAKYSVVAGGKSNTVALGASYSLVGGYQAYAGHNGCFVWGDTSGTTTATTTANSFIVRCSGGSKFCTDNTVGLGGPGPYLNAGDLDWQASCDRNLKKNISQTDNHTILSKLEELTIYEWTSKSAPDDARHISPMAQDFYEVFKLGNSDKRIMGMDVSSISLACIKELNKKYTDFEKDYIKLKEHVKQLEQKIVELQQK